jgi:hypothetical protein
MPKIASVRRLVLSGLALSAAAASALPALAQSAAETPMPTNPQAGPPSGYECASEPVTGSGPGFSSSRDKSEDAAREAWLKKAQAVYPEATWDTAYRAGMSCAVQGLYSKCFAEAIPCRPKPGAEDAGADDNAPDKSAEAPKSE